MEWEKRDGSGGCSEMTSAMAIGVRNQLWAPQGSLLQAVMAGVLGPPSTESAVLARLDMRSRWRSVRRV